jgi:hypothetical protein
MKHKKIFWVIGILIVLFIFSQYEKKQSEYIYEQDGYIYHQFLATGTHQWIIPEGVTMIDVLVVAGGGGGGAGFSNRDRNNGGGGAGGLIFIEGYDITKYTDSISLNIGAGGLYGGNPGSGAGIDGGNTTFGDLLAIGGGGGTAFAADGRDGGSGSGGSRYDTVYGSGGNSIQTTTNDGYINTGFGNSGSISSSRGGGGGGADGAGSGTVGGAGKLIWDVEYAKGGYADNGGTAVRANRGDGGKAGPYHLNTNGESGSSGIVIVRYLSTPAPTCDDLKMDALTSLSAFASNPSLENRQAALLSIQGWASVC